MIVNLYKKEWKKIKGREERKFKKMYSDKKHF